MSDEEWKRATHASLTELYALSKKLGGQLSGEHGIGVAKRPYFLGATRLILNPGKVIEFNK